MCFIISENPGAVLNEITIICHWNLLEHMYFIKIKFTLVEIVASLIFKTVYEPPFLFILYIDNVYS